MHAMKTAIIVFSISLSSFVVLKTFFFDKLISRKVSFTILNSTGADIFSVKLKSGRGSLMEIEIIPKDNYIEKSSWMRPGECWSLEYTSERLGTKKVQLQIYGFDPKNHEIIIFDDIVLSKGIPVAYTDTDC
jgi:hypothetical protein